MRTIKAWLFSVPQDKNSMWDIICWWEIRRIPFNMIVGISGSLSLILFFMFISLSKELKPGEDAIEPMALFAAPIMANIFYTLGWTFEVIVRLLYGSSFARISKKLFLSGIIFSLAIVMFPSVWWAIVLLSRLIFSHASS